MNDKLPDMAQLVPAYGRDYTSAKQAIQALQNGDDFKYVTFNGSTYTSIRDISPGNSVFLRYSKLTRVCSYTVRG